MKDLVDNSSSTYRSPSVFLNKRLFENAELQDKVSPINIFKACKNLDKTFSPAVSVCKPVVENNSLVITSTSNLQLPLAQCETITNSKKSNMLHLKDGAGSRSTAVAINESAKGLADSWNLNIKGYSDSTSANENRMEPIINKQALRNNQQILDLLNDV